MTTLRRTIIILLLFTFRTAFSQDTLSKAQLNYDFKYYVDSLSAKHKNPFTKLSKEDFENRIHQVTQGMALTQNDFIIELMKVNAAIGDEHSNIFPNFKTIFPFEFELFDEGMTITEADSIHQKYLSFRVLGIDNISIDTIAQKFKEIIKQDNLSFFKVFQAYYFNKPTILKGLGIIDDESFATFTLLSPKGDTISSKIASLPISQNRKWVSPVQYKTLLAFQEKSNYWYKFDKQKSILYFNFMHCSETKGLPFELFNKQLFETIRAENPNKIILDLRFNEGGNSAVLGPFIDSIHVNKLNKENHFFVLIGKKVFSSSLMNAVELKRHTNAIFVGQRTGGNINHFGEVRSFRLPNSKVVVTYSTKYWENWKKHDGTLNPDIEVSNSYFDFLKLYDRALETALEK